jgi:hypothetical protein
MLFKVLLEGLSLTLALLFCFLFLTCHLLYVMMSLLLDVSQLFLEIELNIEKFINNLGVKFFQMLMWYFVESIYLIGVVRIKGAFVILLLDNGICILFFVVLVIVGSA